VWASRPGDDDEIEHFVAVVVVARLDGGDGDLEHVFGVVEAQDADFSTVDPSTTLWVHIGAAKRSVGVVGAELCPEDFGSDGKGKLVVGSVVPAPARAETARTTPLTAIA
jgi:hypothetical protein